MIREDKGNQHSEPKGLHHTFRGHRTNQGTNQLWSISVFVPPSASVVQKDILLGPSHLFHQESAGETEQPSTKIKALAISNSHFPPTCLKELCFRCPSTNDKIRGTKVGNTMSAERGECAQDVWWPLRQHRGMILARSFNPIPSH